MTEPQRRTDASAFTKFADAWRKVKLAHSLEGYYGSVSFTDKAIGATIHLMGGWEQFCLALEDGDVMRVQENFERFYRALCRDGVPDHLDKPCTGFHERHNRGRFQEFVPKIRVIS